MTEVWRLDGDNLTVRRLSDDRNGYDSAEKSKLLPGLNVVALADHVRLGRSHGQGEVVARWRQFLAAND